MKNYLVFSRETQEYIESPRLFWSLQEVEQFKQLAGTEEAFNECYEIHEITLFKK